MFATLKMGTMQMPSMTCSVFAEVGSSSKGEKNIGGEKYTCLRKFYCLQELQNFFSVCNCPIWDWAAASTPQGADIFISLKKEHRIWTQGVESKDLRLQQDFISRNWKDSLLFIFRWGEILLRGKWVISFKSPLCIVVWRSLFTFLFSALSFSFECYPGRHHLSPPSVSFCSPGFLACLFSIISEPSWKTTMCGGRQIALQWSLDRWDGWCQPQIPSDCKLKSVWVLLFLLQFRRLWSLILLFPCWSFFFFFNFGRSP